MAGARPAAAVGSLKQEGRDQIMRELFGITPKALLDSRKLYKVLVVDAFSTKVLSACVKMSDITEAGISLVEKLDVQREPLPTMEAIYFVTPTRASVTRIIADFQRGKKKYAKAHLVFTGALSGELMSLISRERSLAHEIGTLKELNMEFLAKEDRIFSIDAPETFHDLFSVRTGADQHREAYQKITSRLATVCMTLGELTPHIRYQRSANGVATHANQVANGLHEHLVKLSKNGAQTSGGAQRKPATVLVLDRTVDMVAPLLHELTYEAMVHDRLDNVDANGTVRSTGADGKPHEEILASESDEQWFKYRHMHISELATTVREDFQEWKQSSVIASRPDRQNGGSAGAKDTAEMMRIVKELPKYNKESPRVAMHVNLAFELNKAFHSDNSSLSSMCEQEMNMSFGADVSGSRLKDDRIDKEFGQLLIQPGISEADQLRLLAIYQLTQQQPVPRSIKPMLTTRADDESLIARNLVRDAFPFLPVYISPPHMTLLRKCRMLSCRTILSHRRGKDSHEMQSRTWIGRRGAPMETFSPVQAARSSLTSIPASAHGFSGWVKIYSMASWTVVRTQASRTQTEETRDLEVVARAGIDQQVVHGGDLQAPRQKICRGLSYSWWAEFRTLKFEAFTSCPKSSGNSLR